MQITFELNRHQTGRTIATIGAGIHPGPATSTHTGLICAGLIKENSERFVGVATLLDNAQGSTQAFLAPWLGMSHVASRTSNLISQYLQAPVSSSIFKLIILQHDLLHGGRSKLASYIIGSVQ